ncbi:hypothetical protein E8E13_006290 [Curvularia kusanoi]|uniref:Uncharacterized protein n=1 Tax=Curvularia kusanoi TaxID=90978 RepID=A0A9P4T9V4_CURKU|nr:hypothetical protein E8E13_006290 [Curvularia kusanoi]
MTTSARRIRKTKASFNGNAPPGTIPFPRTANMTAAEILAFLPNSIDCADVVYRLISNGGSRKSVHAIINTHRNFDTEWSANCCGEAMYKTMEKAGYVNWTITKHNQWHGEMKSAWNGLNLDVGGLRTASDDSEESISFSRLAENVRTMPEGDDALDLTRMVTHCIQHAEEGWLYPRDYEELLNQIGGPVRASDANTDSHVFRRWENKKAPPPSPTPPKSLQPSQGSGSLGGRPRTKRKSSGAPRRKSRNTTTEPDLVVHVSTEEDEQQTEATWNSLDDIIGASEPVHESGQPYSRAPAQFVPLPPIISVTEPMPTVAQAFRAEGFTGESDPYSAYAFGGPRYSPPYRYLHEIAQPDPWDVNGWAENLRWAFEQRVLFGRDHTTALGWNESPAHMTCIEQERMQQVWASDELLEEIMKEIER